MPRIAGALSFKNNLKNKEDMLLHMINSLNCRGDSFKENKIYLNHNCSLASDEDGFYKYNFNNEEYTIVLDGDIFNKEELKEELKENGFEFETTKDTEILIKLFIAYGERMFEKIDGTFSFILWDGKNESVYLVKDPFGVKPLYYTKVNDIFLFSSEIKGLLGSKIVEPVLDKNGLEELVLFGPDHINGKTYFKNIYEVKNSSFIKLSKLNEISFGFLLKEHVYWKIKEYKHEDALENTIFKIRKLLDESIYNSISINDNIGAMLSGGLDSSILVWLIAKNYENIKKEKFKTFSIKYKDNDKNFVKNDFEQSQDSDFIKLIVEKLDLDHTEIEIDTPELYLALEDALLARDMPGMADIDSSLYLFAKKMKEKIDVVISGECSDEIFGGYPWYFKSSNSFNFPWSNAIDIRQKLLKKSLQEKINVKEVISKRYFYETSNIEDKNKQKINLTMNYFMQTLIDRSDRMCLHNNLKILIPFCNKKIVEYLWNIPWEMKALNGREKGLLRFAYKDILPDEIIYRKKSPYPKTFNPNYMLKVREKLLEIINNNNSKINYIFDKEFILELINDSKSDFETPWFGQLMRKPQFMAYLITVNMWLEKYNIKIDL